MNISLTQIFSAAYKLVSLGKGNCCDVTEAQLYQAILKLKGIFFFSQSVLRKKKQKTCLLQTQHTMYFLLRTMCALSVTFQTSAVFAIALFKNKYG